MRRALQNAMLGAYRVIFARGLMHVAWGRRLFFASYEIYKSQFEAGPIEALRAHVPAGALVVDVGANVGFFTVRFARWVGPTGRVIAFEPEAKNFAELTRRLTGKRLIDRVDLRWAVADARSGVARLVVNPEHPGDHRLGEHGVPVEAIALDDLRETGRRVSLIKIDVQGAEMRVLEGASALIARDHPALFVEIEPAGLRRFGSDLDMLLTHLERFGYAPHRLVREGATRCARGDIEREIAERGYIDVLFLAPAA